MRKKKKRGVRGSWKRVLKKRKINKKRPTGICTLGLQLMTCWNFGINISHPQGGGIYLVHKGAGKDYIAQIVFSFSVCYIEQSYPFSRCLIYILQLYHILVCRF